MISGLISGITFIVLFQSGEAYTMEENTHTHIHARTHTHTMFSNEFAITICMRFMIFFHQVGH